jgi:hypothetical protein
MRRGCLASNPWPVGPKDETMKAQAMDKWQQPKQYDQQRPSFPGEHLLVLAAGLGLWMVSRRHPSLLVRGAGLAAGSARAGRAASGRDGLRKLLRVLPVGRGIR